MRICGNLEIEEALHTLLHYLQEFVPAAKAFLQYYQVDCHAMRTIAYADETEFSKLDLLTPLSKTAREWPCIQFQKIRILLIYDIVL